MPCGLLQLAARGGQRQHQQHPGPAGGQRPPPLLLSVKEAAAALVSFGSAPAVWRLLADASDGGCDGVLFDVTSGAPISCLLLLDWKERSDESQSS